MPAKEKNGIKKEKKWIKLWIGFLTSPKFFKWPDKEVFCYIKMVALSATAKEEGILDVDMDDDFLAWRFHSDISLIKDTKKRLLTPSIDPITKEKGVMGIELPDGRFRIINYYKHQSDWGRIKKYYQTPGKEQKKKEPTKEELDIFVFWNSAGCMQHKDIDEHLTRIIKTLSKYPTKEIKEAITNYGKVYKEPEYWYNHSWRLKDFLSRGMEQFFTKNNPFEKLKKYAGKKPELADDTKRMIKKSKEK